MYVKMVSPLYILSSLFLGFLLETTETCPTGWLRHENTCYHFSHDTEPWTGAIAMCTIVGGKIVEIETAEENAYLAAEAKLLKHWFWIGLTDVQEENTWIWVNSHTKLGPGSYSNWYPNEPNNSNDDENCVTLDGNTGMWNDGECAVRGHYICEVENEGPEVVG